ncbi:MAG TPA: ABC transporter substrate-binding protein [Acidimicrobiales bacterium]|nr:ABC transporter substrate-binding protein [Acidimicrobiales bacterium]
MQLQKTMRARAKALALMVATSSMVAGTLLAGAVPAGATTVAQAKTLNLAFGADMQVPDPDIFYEIEGNAVVTSVYEGLVKYANNSTKIIPALATKWSVTPDGLTYTFTLRSGVKFHDGTPFNSAAAMFSFQRRKGVNSAPAYMVADVTSMATPTPTTFVVHLDKPVSAFLDYLAAPYGPKMVSPTLVKAHEVGAAPGDWAQKYLSTHDAGTGPYSISAFVPGSHYDLVSNPGSWGGKPYYTKVHIAIVPDISTQQVELGNGQLSMILHGLSVNAVSSFKSNPNFEVKNFPAELKAMLTLNPTLGVFKSAAVRIALRSAIDKKAIVASVYGNSLATVSTQAYPVGEFPAGMAKDNPTYDPTKLRNALKSASGSKKIDLVYSTDNATNQRVAEFVQTELQADGLQVTIRGVPIGQIFNYATESASKVPNALIWTVNPDDAHPDSWIRIFSNTQGALNEMHGSVPAADALMDAGLHSTNPKTIQADYAKAGELIANSGEAISIADVNDTVVAAKGITGFFHQPPTADTVVLGDLHPVGQ